MIIDVLCISQSRLNGYRNILGGEWNALLISSMVYDWISLPIKREGIVKGVYPLCCPGK